MTPKEYLSQYRLLNARINAKTEQVARLLELATKVSPSQSDGGHSSGVSDRVGSIVAKIVDAETEINCEIDRLVDLQREIESVIAKVPDATLRQLLELRYINCKTWEQIAVDMSYTDQWVCILHGRALRYITVDSN